MENKRWNIESHAKGDFASSYLQREMKGKDHEYESPGPEGTKLSTRQVIDGINLAVTQTQRINILTNAISIFHHTNETEHDTEIKMGAANALCLKLGYVFLQSQREMTEKSSIHNDNWREVFMICSILSMIYGGCSDQAREKSFDNIGITELLSLLVQVIESYQRYRLQIQSKIKTGTQTDTLETKIYNSVVKSTQVIRSFAKLNLAKAQLVNWNDGYLLCVLVTTLDVKLKNKENNDEAKLNRRQFTKVEVEAAGLIKDLTHRAQDGTKVKIFNHPGLIDIIVKTTLITDFDSEEDSTNIASPDSNYTKCIEYSSAIIWNLAITNELKVPLATSLNVLDAVLRLTANSCTKAKKNAVSALGNLASEEKNKLYLVNYQNGIIINTLMKIVASDTDCGARRRAARTLRCISDRNAAQVLVNHQGFIELMAKSATTECDRDTRLQVVEAIVSIASAMLQTKSNLDQILKAIVQIINDSTNVECLEIISSDLLQQLLKTIDCSSLSCSPELLKAISKMAMIKQSSAGLKRQSAEALKMLCSAEENKQIMVCRPVLDALSSLASLYGLEEKTRTAAVEAIISLTSLKSNRTMMAEHEKLLTTLVNFALSSPEGKLKDNTKDAILQLVPEL